MVSYETASMLRITDPSGQGLAFPLLPIAVVFEEPTDGWVAIGGDDGVNLQLWITLHQCSFHDVYVVFKPDVKPLAVVCLSIFNQTLSAA